jgi:hypothetical protein
LLRHHTLQDFTFADALATILYNWKPEALHAFLDLSKDKFAFKIEQAAGSTYVDFVIGRTGNTAMVSAAYALLLTSSTTHHASGPFHSPLPRTYNGMATGMALTLP